MLSINLYGATKLCSDKLFISANIIKEIKIKFSVRYGNVLVAEDQFMVSLKIFKIRVIFQTNSNMTRFNITLNQGIDVVFYAISNSFGGEIIVPKLKVLKF